MPHRTRHVLTGEQRARDRRAIIDGSVDGHVWPMFPALPVIRDLEPEEYKLQGGVIAWRFMPEGVEDRPVRVWLCYLPDLNHKAEGIRECTGQKDVTWGELLDDAPTIDYATLDEFFDDGWRAD